MDYLRAVYKPHSHEEFLGQGSYLARGELPKPSKAKEMGKAREELVPVSRAIQLTQAIADLADHASRGGRSKPLDRDSLMRLFETAGFMAQEAVAAQRENFERCVKRYKDDKTRAREKVL